MSQEVRLDGRALKAERDRLGLTLEETAEQLGLEPHVYAGLEKGTRSLSRRQATRVVLLLAQRDNRAELAPPVEKVPGEARPPIPAAVHAVAEQLAAIATGSEGNRRG